jgi:hypothetical protein
MTIPPVVLWVDPGKMTGVAYLNERREFAADEWPFGPACREIGSLCERFGRTLAIGWERFDINSETHKKTQAGTKDAMHMIGACRYLVARYECRFLGEAHQHTPTPVERDQLKRLGWWRPGKDDAQSAACHMFRWLMAEGELTPAQRELLYS